jgi:beta-phosphoglucomutase-like phosphatase (HAD superfamily)
MTGAIPRERMQRILGHLQCSASNSATRSALQGVQLCVFDMAGTTVDDAVGGVPLFVLSVKDAFTSFTNGALLLTSEEINPHRGKEKRDAIRALVLGKKDFFEERCLWVSRAAVDKIESTVDAIFAKFKKQLDANVNKVDAEIPGTSEVFAALRRLGIKIAVGRFDSSHTFILRCQSTYSFRVHIFRFSFSLPVVSRGKLSNSLCATCAGRTSTMSGRLRARAKAARIPR